MDVNFGVKLHNRFDAVVTDAKTGEVKQVAKAENVGAAMCVVGKC